MPELTGTSNAAKTTPTKMGMIEEKVARVKNTQGDINERLNSLRNNLIGPVSEMPKEMGEEKPNPEGSMGRIQELLEIIDDQQKRSFSLIDQLFENLST
ncbi:hypothetical protein LCGC14_0503690 [marine sediment metagenome]|uniref:Uncharacterized protein n=1 Tax=marine sediment metagenome TaxID=412755 RepID=A0A0F9UQ14_9ZZZZ